MRVLPLKIPDGRGRADALKFSGQNPHQTRGGGACARTHGGFSELAAAKARLGKYKQ